MEKKYFLIITLLFVFTLGFSQNPFISEIHYDNCAGGPLCTGSDTDEGVEIAGTPGFDLSGWELVFYEGRFGTVYKTVSLTGTIPANGFLWTPITGISDDFWDYLNPSGIALVNTNMDPDEVVEFLSYRNSNIGDYSFTATNGPASGMTSTYIGVQEQLNTAVGLSLQRTDAGWVGPIAATPGQPNTGLTLDVSEDVITEFNMYPNPVTSGKLHISFNAYEKQVDIYSVLGKQVYSKKVKSEEAIDVSNLTSGFYMIRVGEEDKMVTRRLLIK